MTESKWNAFLRDHIPKLLLQAFRKWKMLGLQSVASAPPSTDAAALGQELEGAEVNLLAQEVLVPFLRLIPLDEHLNERFFRRIATDVAHVLQSEPCLLTEVWAVPNANVPTERSSGRRFVVAFC